MDFPEILQRLAFKDNSPLTPSWDGCSTSEAMDQVRHSAAKAGREVLSLFEEVFQMTIERNERGIRNLLKQPERFTLPLISVSAEIESLFSLNLTSSEISVAGQLQLVTVCLRRIASGARELAILSNEYSEANPKADFSVNGKNELSDYSKMASKLLNKALVIFEEQCFDKLRSFQEEEDSSDEQESSLKDSFFLSFGEEGHDNGMLYLSTLAECKRCCELAGEIACSITGREKL